MSVDNAAELPRGHLPGRTSRTGRHNRAAGAVETIVRYAEQAARRDARHVSVGAAVQDQRRALGGSGRVAAGLGAMPLQERAARACS